MADVAMTARNDFEDLTYNLSERLSGIWLLLNALAESNALHLLATCVDECRDGIAKSRKWQLSHKQC